VLDLVGLVRQFASRLDESIGGLVTALQVSGVRLEEEDRQKEVQQKKDPELHHEGQIEVDHRGPEGRC